jgi:hypothetical protein
MASSISAALAISDEKFLPSLRKYDFNERMIRTFQREPGFGELRSRSHQACFVTDLVRETAGQELSVNQLARAFECDPAGVKAALTNVFVELKIRDRRSAFGVRRSAFDDDSEGEILIWIEAQAEKSKSMTRTNLRHYC